MDFTKKKCAKRTNVAAKRAPTRAQRWSKKPKFAVGESGRNRLFFSDGCLTGARLSGRAFICSYASPWQNGMEELPTSPWDTLPRSLLFEPVDTHLRDAMQEKNQDDRMSSGRERVLKLAAGA